MSKPKLYFAHPINVYNTELEAELLAVITDMFGETYAILNPNGPEHDAGYKAKGMKYFLEDVVPECEACVLLAFRDGKIGKGVYAEAETLYNAGCEVWEILPESLFNLWSPNPDRCLSVEQTRERIRNPDRSPKPY